MTKKAHITFYGEFDLDEADLWAGEDPPKDWYAKTVLVLLKEDSPNGELIETLLGEWNCLQYLGARIEVQEVQTTSEEVILPEKS